MSRRYRNHIKIYKTQNKRLTRATSNGIPSPTDIKFFELNDIPYLANNSPEELWQKAAKRFGLEGEDCLNLRQPNNQQKAVEDYIGVQGFPTYVLVAPDGTIVTNKAPRPSNAQNVREAVLKLIEK